MKIDSHGIKQNKGSINSLLAFLEETLPNQKWGYMGLIVEIDPTVDHNNQNILIRWTDLVEGFNDRLIVHSLEEFHTLFVKFEQ